MADLGNCPLCGRKLVVGRSVNRHHLVPRSRDGRETVALHRVCHAAIHAALSEKELERRYNTIERLRDHPQLSRFHCLGAPQAAGILGPYAAAALKSRRSFRGSRAEKG